MIIPYVFVVDDYDSVRVGIVSRLEREQLRVRGFKTGESLIQALQNETPDMIVLDYQMPDMNGLETLRAVRKNFLFIPVVMLTAYQGTMDLKAVHELGVHCVLTKSVEFDELIHVVKDMVGV